MNLARRYLSAIMIAYTLACAMTLVYCLSQKHDEDRTPQITIEKGVSRSDVYKVLGKPGDYSTKRYFWPPLGTMPMLYEIWMFDGCVIAIYFGDAANVKDLIIYNDIQELHYSWYELLSDWFDRTSFQLIRN